MTRISTTLCFLLSGWVTTAHADLSDCGISDVVVIDNVSFVAGDDISCSAATRITLGPNITIGDGARLSLTAPLIELTPVVQVINGGVFLANTGATVLGIGILNDTGILACGNKWTNDLECPQVDYPGQDAEYGRDVGSSDSDGHAGFSFTKLDVDGYPLPALAPSWSCVKDNVTGLVWEVKTDDDGLRDKDWTYTWYNTDSNTNGGLEGYQDGGNCTGSSCDTQGYVQAVNSQGLCGFSDWGMPTIKALENIVTRDRVNPTIDTRYFPNTLSSYYWSGSPSANYLGNAWRIPFSEGDSYYSSKSQSYYVRLVRSGQ